MNKRQSLLQLGVKMFVSRQFKLRYFVAILTVIASTTAYSITFESLSSIDTPGRGQLVDVIITLDDANKRLKSLYGETKNKRKANLHKRLELIDKHQGKLLSRLQARNFKLQYRHSHLPIISMQINRAAFNKLKNTPGISLSKNRLMRPLLSESIPKVFNDAMYDPTAVFDRGSGWSVAVLDTGVESGHSFLGGGSRLVAEACYSKTSSDNVGTSLFTSLCPGGAASSTAVGSGQPCGLTGCEHGTAVAGVSIGDGNSSDGVATAASLISIQVYTEIGDTIFPGTFIGTFSSELISAMNRVLVLHDGDNGIDIAAVLLASGDESINGNCDGEDDAIPIKAAMDNLRAQDVATIVSSGNQGSTGGVNLPACVSTAIAVGASDDTDDTRWSLSNEGSMLDLYAPGVDITSSSTSGGSLTATGTSFAAAHVAGAWAYLKQLSSHATVDQIEAVLKATGVPVAGTTTSAKRIQLEAAAATEIPEIEEPTFFIIKSKSGKVITFSL